MKGKMSTEQMFRESIFLTEEKKSDTNSNLILTFPETHISTKWKEYIFIHLYFSVLFK